MRKNQQRRLEEAMTSHRQKKGDSTCKKIIEGKRVREC
jgi:hypothetical protein